MNNPDKPQYVSAEGLKRLQAELEELRTAKRAEVAQRIHAAMEFGDYSENSELEQAKNDQAFLEGRIMTLEQTIKNARLIDEKSKHDIVEVIHLSVYRPVSSKVALKGAGRRHGGALAIDAAIFKTKGGRTLSVEKDFHGRIGTKPCPAPDSASELRKIACEANDARLFNVLLTPDYNWAHRNHFHMEVTAGVRWTLVR